MKKIFQQDDCAPDSMDAFEEMLGEVTGYTWKAFQELATKKKNEMGYELFLDEWVVSWSCDDPFYVLGKVEDCELGQPSSTGEKWYFTFGQGHYTPEGYPLKDVVVEIEGSYGEARQLLVEVVGDMFAFQYESKEAAGVERFGLNVVSLEKLREAFDWE